MSTDGSFTGSSPDGLAAILREIIAAGLKVESVTYHLRPGGPAIVIGTDGRPTASQAPEPDRGLPDLSRLPGAAFVRLPSDVSVLGGGDRS